MLIALKNNNFIETFELQPIGYLSFNVRICDLETLDLVSNIFKKNKKLINFNISGLIDFMKYDDLNTMHIILNKFANALQINKTLQNLNLSDCRIGNRIEFICKGLQNNSSLKTINLSSNLINNETIKYVADYLKNNKTLEYIDLTINDSCTISGLKILLEGLEFNTTLLKCDIFEGSLDYEIKDWFMSDIDIDEFTGIIIDDNYMETIIKLLSNCKAIHTHSLEHNHYKNMYIENMILYNENKYRIVEKIANTIDNNNYLYENSFWTPPEHLVFKDILNFHDIFCHELIMTSLICNSNLYIKLPMQIWQYIFSFYQLKQFLLN